MGCTQASKEVRQKQKQAYQQELEPMNEIQAWLEKIHSVLEAQGKVAFSDFFYQILDSKVDSTNMAMQLVDRLISRYHKSLHYRVTIGGFIHKPDYPHHTISEMTIQKLPDSGWI